MSLLGSEIMGNSRQNVFVEICLCLIITIWGCQGVMETQNGLIAFDCTADTVNITSFSLLDVEQCKFETENIITKSTNIQVVQTNKYLSVHVFQCKVIFRRRIQYCGMFSHLRAYEGSYRYILREFTSDECRDLHKMGYLRVHDNVSIRELTRNTTSHGEVYVAGRLEGSRCTGGTYFDGTTHYKNVLVALEYEIDLYDYQAKLDVTDGSLTLRTGLVCPFKPGYCLDAKLGYMTWETDIDQDCTTGQYSVIYNGIANKTFNDKKDSSSDNFNVLFSALKDDQLFSIKVKKSFEVCGFPAFETDHKQIYVLEVSPGSEIIRNKNEIDAKDLDLITYFNSKITVVENHLSNQLTLMYQQLVNELCKVEKSLLETRLINARVNPTEFASNLMKRTGYTAVIAGEIIYIIQCLPTYVILAPSTSCYQEIPVRKDNVTLFMSPVTHVLQRHSIQIQCTPLLPAKYRFGSDWFSIDGSLHRVTPPNILSSDLKTDWKYDYLPSLMSIGLYTENNVRRMHEFIYDSEDRRSLATVLHRTVSGYGTDKQGFDFDSLINENVIETTIHKYWNKLLSFSTFLGQITSSIVGFWLIGKLIKFVIDSLVHCRILFDIYGMSWKLIASFWDSLTNLLTHKHHIRRERYQPGIFEAEKVDEDIRKMLTNVVKEPVVSTDFSRIHNDLFTNVGRSGVSTIYPIIDNGSHELTIEINRINTDPVPDKSRID